MISKIIKKEQGLSLVELMVALSLLGIVLALGYMYFNFGMQSYDRGERRTIAQQAVRMTADFITKEIRFAKQIEINPSDGVNESGYRYIYLKDDSVIFRDEAGAERILADSQTDEMPFNVQFNSNVPDDVVIFDLDADNGLYSLHTRVQALNLELYRKYNMELYGVMIKVNEGSGPPYTVIKFKNPDSD
jgi:prepilin-type N-terminal cleavage/methylation domain-containing protein